MDWIDIIPHQHMVEAVKENFFPTFLRTVSSWASSGNYSMVEMNHWFTSWLALFPEKLKNDPSIKGGQIKVLMLLMVMVGHWFYFILLISFYNLFPLVFCHSHF